MKHLNKIAVLLFLGLVFCPALSFADISKKVSFQGRLTDNTGVPISGTKNFIFNFFNKNDVLLKTLYLPITVKNGMYSASLDLEDMQNEYFADDLYLEVKIDREKIVEKAQLTASLYALSVRDLAITDRKIADEAVTNLKIKAGAVTEDKIADRAVTFHKLSALNEGNGRFLKMDNNTLSWANIPNSLPNQSGHEGEYLKTDGSSAMWSKLKFTEGLTENNGEVSVKFPLPVQFPSLSGHSNKFLTNNGTDLSWEDLSSSYVTTHTVQIITGKKTFNEIVSSNLTISGSGNSGSAVLQYSLINGNINAYGLVINSTTNIKGNLNVTGTTYNENADLAEIYPSSELLNPGEVVVISQTRDGYIEKSKTANDTKAAGVISSKPGIVLNSDAAGYQLALAGKVPVNITNEGGNIKRGDLLVTSSSPGYAMKAPENPKPGTIIGKALENFTGSRGKILALVNLQ